mmetsp:Transcript_106333/g.204541  ORF Transcript_106333/g.204541 Transcript_106333/m.204541 type:complete len:525 (-) Transcript_106333:69-1643(-)
MAEVAALSEKFRKFGVLGAGVIPDSLATVRLAESLDRERAQEAGTVGAPPASAAEGQSEALATASAHAASTSEAQGSGSAVSSWKLGPGETLSRQQILEILSETARVQGIVQQEISVLARELATSKNGKKKRKPLSFVDGHKKIQELGLPKEPLEEHGLTETAFQKLLLQYEEDEEVMTCAQKLLHPAGKGDPDRARRITMDRIIEIHQFMVTEMQKVLQEFLQLPQDVRRTFTGKGCETTAELLVSVAVEQQLLVRCEDVEQAVIMYEDALGGNPEFTRCTEQLASMMQHLIGSCQPRLAKTEFLRVLVHLGECTKKAKAFAKSLYEDYRAKRCGVEQAYRRFEVFNEEAAQSADADLPDLSSVEMQLCFEEYRSDSEVKQAWEKSGAETNVLMQNMMINGSREPLEASSSSRGMKKKKASEVVEMQELMVDELKRVSEATATALRNGAAKQGPWKAELAVQMVQALASAAVERRYGVSAEEMTLMGFQQATSLQKSERFVRATEKQQEILMTIPQLCQSNGN